MLPLNSACTVKDIEKFWKKHLNDAINFNEKNTKILSAKFLPRSPEFNDRIRIINLTKLLEMNMDKDSIFKIMNEKENKKLLFNISVQIGAMYSISKSLKRRFERILSEKNYKAKIMSKYLGKIWLYMSYLYFPMTKNDAIGREYVMKLFQVLKTLLKEFPKILELNLKLEEKRDELINLTKNVSTNLLGSNKVREERIRISEFRLETSHATDFDSLFVNALKEFSKPIEEIIDDSKNVPMAEIDSTMASIITLESDIQNIFEKNPFNSDMKNAELFMGLLYENDCLKFVYKSLNSLKSIKILPSNDFTITENEIIPILQAIVFLGEALTNAAGILEEPDNDKTIVRTLISLRNIIIHKMNAKKLNDYFWNGLLKELKEMTEKIKERMEFLETLFLESDPAKLDKIKNVPYLYDANLPENQNLPQIQNTMSKKGKKKKLLTEDEEIDLHLQKPEWQNHDYKFLRSWQRALSFKDYKIDDPLNEEIREVVKSFIGIKKDKPENPDNFYFLINSALENVHKIEQLSKENLAFEKTLFKKFLTDSENGDITLFLKLSYFMDQICQTFKDSAPSDIGKDKKIPEAWQELSRRLDKMNEHRLFEFLYNQIQNGRNLCIHHSWINETEYQRFANVIHLILTNLKPMLLRLSYKRKRPILLPGINFFAKSLLNKIEKMEKIMADFYFHMSFRNNVLEIKDCNAEMLKIYIKEDRSLKSFFKLQKFIIQIFNLLQNCQTDNSLLWKRFKSNICTSNKKEQKFEAIYNHLEFAKNISPRSLWKNNDEYLIFANTILLILNNLKPMLLPLTTKKIGNRQKHNGFGRRRRLNNIQQQKFVLGDEAQICQDTINLWRRLLLIKATLSPLTIKE